MLLLFEKIIFKYNTISHLVQSQWAENGKTVQFIIWVRVLIKKLFASKAKKSTFSEKNFISPQAPSGLFVLQKKF